MHTLVSAAERADSPLDLPHDPERESGLTPPGAPTDQAIRADAGHPPFCIRYWFGFHTLRRITGHLAPERKAGVNHPGQRNQRFRVRLLDDHTIELRYAACGGGEG